MFPSQFKWTHTHTPLRNVRDGDKVHIVRGGICTRWTLSRRCDTITSGWIFYCVLTCYSIYIIHAFIHHASEALIGSTILPATPYRYTKLYAQYNSGLFICTEWGGGIWICICIFVYQPHLETWFAARRANFIWKGINANKTNNTYQKPSACISW